MKRQTRSEARKAAFTLIFQLNQHGDDVSGMLDMLLEENPACESNLGYISKVVGEVNEKREEINSTIEKYLRKGWTLKRIPKVAHSVLKLAIYEMKYLDDVPVRVAINEAVEIAKNFGDEEQSKFVNGLLGSYAKDLEKSE